MELIGHIDLLLTFFIAKRIQKILAESKLLLYTTCTLKVTLKEEL